MTLPKCPHCNYAFDSEDVWHTGSTDFPQVNDGDIKETKCLSCDKPLRIMLSLQPTWSFLDDDDNELIHVAG